MKEVGDKDGDMDCVGLYILHSVVPSDVHVIISVELSNDENVGRGDA